MFEIIVYIVFSLPSYFCQVDQFSGTSTDSIWAVGDGTNRLNFTLVALIEGSACEKHIWKRTNKTRLQVNPCMYQETFGHMWLLIHFLVIQQASLFHEKEIMKRNVEA